MIFGWIVYPKKKKNGVNSLDTLAHSLPEPVKTLLSKSQAANPIHSQFSLHTAGGSVTAEQRQTVSYPGQNQTWKLVKE